MTVMPGATHRSETMRICELDLIHYFCFWTEIMESQISMMLT